MRSNLVCRELLWMLGHCLLFECVIIAFNSAVLPETALESATPKSRKICSSIHKSWVFLFWHNSQKWLSLPGCRSRGKGTPPPPHSPVGPRSCGHNYTPVHKQPSQPAHLHTLHMEPPLSHLASPPSPLPPHPLLHPLFCPFKPHLSPSARRLLHHSLCPEPPSSGPQTPDFSAYSNTALTSELPVLVWSLVLFPLDYSQASDSASVIVLHLPQCYGLGLQKGLATLKEIGFWLESSPKNYTFHLESLSV